MDAPQEKLSATRPLNFRPGAELSAKIAEMQAEVEARGGSITVTSIIRDGLLACWPEIRAALLVRHTVPPAQADDVARLVAMCQRALELGVTVDQLEARLATDVEANLIPFAR